MKKNVDALLKQALTPTQAPGVQLNQEIIRQAKEREDMGKKRAGKLPAAAAAAFIVLAAGSVTAYASWRYLAPEKVTEHFKDAKLAEAFQSKTAVTVNEQQTIGGYRVTLLGMVSGKDLTHFQASAGGEILDDRTYAVTAIEYADGTPMPDTSDEAYSELSFFVSPLIKGYDPVQYNAVTMRGGYSELMQDGVLYRVTECDNVEIFADHGLYLCVSDSTFYDNQAYRFDKTTGEIARKEGYQGLNALFELPIDKAKADPQAAAEYLKSLAEPEKTSDEVPKAMQRKEEEIEQWMEKLTPDTIDLYAKRVESTVQTLTPDSDGYVSYQYKIKGRGSGSGKICVQDYFEGKGAGMSEQFPYSYSDAGLDSLKILTFTLGEDGTVTFAAYIPK